MSFTVRRPPVLVFIVMVLLAGGCSDGDDASGESTVATTALSTTTTPEVHEVQEDGLTVVNVFLEDSMMNDSGTDLSPTGLALMSDLVGIDGVLEVWLVDKIEAVDEARELFSDDTAMLAVIESNPRLLPASRGGGEPAALQRSGEDAFCEALAVVVRLSDEFRLSTNDVLLASLRAVETGVVDEQRFMNEVWDAADHLDALLPDLLAAYDEAMLVAPDEELASAVHAVRELSDLLLSHAQNLFAMAESVADVAQVGDQVTALASAPQLEELTADAVTGTVTIDEYAFPQCGFRFSE